MAQQPQTFKLTPEELAQARKGQSVVNAPQSSKTDVAKAILKGIPLPPGVRQGVDFLADELTNPENISAGGGMAGGLAGGSAGAALGAFGGPFAPVTIPAGAILGATTGGTLASRYGEGKPWGEAIQEGAWEGLTEGLTLPIAFLAKPAMKLARMLGYTALDPSPASLAEFWDAVRPGERFIPEEAERLVKDVMFDMSEGAPGSLRYAKQLGVDLDEFRASKLAALTRTGKDVGVGIEEMLSGLAQLRAAKNTPGGALDIPGELTAIDRVEDMVRDRPPGEWRPVSRGALPMPPTRMETNAPYSVDSFGNPTFGSVVEGQRAEAIPNTLRRNPNVNPDLRVSPVDANTVPVLGEAQTSLAPTSVLPPPPQYLGEMRSPSPDAGTRTGVFYQDPDYMSLPSAPFRAEALTMTEADQLMQRIDDALLSEYGKSAPAAMAGIRVPETATTAALKDVRAKLKQFMEARAAGATFRNADTTVRALNDAMHRTIPFERMAAEATSRERGGPALRIAMGRNAPRISLVEYLGRRTGGYLAPPLKATAQVLPDVAKLSPALARLAAMGLRPTTSRDKE